MHFVYGNTTPKHTQSKSKQSKETLCKNSMRVDSYTIYIHDKVKILFSKQDFRDYSLGLVKGRELTKVLSNYGDVKNSGLVIPLKKWLLCRFIIFFSNFICQKVENLNLTIASCPKERGFSKLVAHA